MSGADEAYNRDQLKNSVVLQDILRVFIKGIKDAHIARTLIRKRPRNLDEALKLALEMQRNNIAFDITRGTHVEVVQDTRDIEPMDVSRIAATQKEEGEVEEDEGFQDALWDQVEQLADKQDHTIQAISALCERFESWREPDTDTTSEDSEEYSDESEDEYQGEEHTCAFIERGSGASNMQNNKALQRSDKFRRGMRYNKNRITDSKEKGRKLFQARYGDRRPQNLQKDTQDFSVKGRNPVTKIPTRKYPQWGSRPEYGGQPSKYYGYRYQKWDKNGGVQKGYGKPLRWDSVTGKPICARCSLPGHTRKECKVRLANKGQTQPNFQKNL